MSKTVIVTTSRDTDTGLWKFTASLEDRTLNAFTSAIYSTRHAAKQAAVYWIQERWPNARIVV